MAQLKYFIKKSYLCTDEQKRKRYESILESYWSWSHVMGKPVDKNHFAEKAIVDLKEDLEVGYTLNLDSCVDTPEEVLETEEKCDFVRWLTDYDRKNIKLVPPDLE